VNLLTPILIAVTLTLVRIAPPPPPNHDAVDRFLAQKTEPLTSAVTFRHLEATTRGGSMRGWIDACTMTDGNDMRYSIVRQGGSGAVRRRALIAALEGEAKARRGGDTGRANLHPDNYEFMAAAAADGLVRVAIRPRRSDALLIKGSMYLAPDDGDLVRIEGALVKAPSIWTRRVRVDRRYARVAGIRVPVSMKSTAQVLVVGESTFSMDYSYLAINGAPVVDPRAPARARACGGVGMPQAGAGPQANSTGHARASAASEPGERPAFARSASARSRRSFSGGGSEAAKRRASERAGESEGRSPSGN
jgi:hypothetical protein